MNETHKKSKTSTNPIDSLANHLGTSVKRLNNEIKKNIQDNEVIVCLLYTSPSPRDRG